MSNPCIRPACRALNVQCGCANSRRSVCARCGKAMPHMLHWCVEPPTQPGQPGPYDDDGDASQ